MTKKPKKPRKRGGVSLPCPECHANSRVLKTRRPTGERMLVIRVRECLKQKKHLFTTVEDYAV